ncbi:MAG: hypothetical protein GX957_08315 [Clostridiaceae bacterium]|nr:hypothetical protein [Clostridiaceae bacterium]
MDRKTKLLCCVDNKITYNIYEPKSILIDIQIPRVDKLYFRQTEDLDAKPLQDAHYLITTLHVTLQMTDRTECSLKS